jgi:poly [ADP-ribose] polymerase 10/14/15
VFANASGQQQALQAAADEMAAQKKLADAAAASVAQAHQQARQAAADEMAAQKKLADAAAASVAQAHQQALQAAKMSSQKQLADAVAANALGVQVFANALGSASRALQWQNEYDQWANYDPVHEQLVLDSAAKGVMLTQFMAGNNQEYTVDLVKMLQTNTKYGTVRGLRWVQKQPLGSSDQDQDRYPDYWDLSQLPTDPTQYATVKLSPLSQTFQAAEALFTQTAPSSVGIVSVEVIQHSHRWKAFQFKRDMVEVALRARGGARETRCFHGTSHDNVGQISASGFLRDFNQASVWGKGTYFARDASYSCDTRYSKKNQHGEQVMFLARIILGESCLGTKGKAMPDAKPGQSCLLFESMVNQIANPSIYVLGTGSDDHAYTDLLIRFNSASVAAQLRAQSGWGDGWMGVSSSSSRSEPRAAAPVPPPPGTCTVSHISSSSFLVKLVAPASTAVLGCSPVTNWQVNVQEKGKGWLVWDTTTKLLGPGPEVKGTLLENQKQVMISGLSSDTEYSVQIQLYSSDGWGKTGQSAIVTTSSAIPLPAAAPSLVDVKCRSMVVKWTLPVGVAAGDGGATHCQVNVKGKSLATWLTYDTQSGKLKLSDAACIHPAASACEVLITGLVPKEEYEVQIAFKNASGWGLLGTVASATTPSRPQAPLPGAAPCLLDVTCTTMVVKWRVPAGAAAGDSDATHCQVNIRQNGEPWLTYDAKSQQLKPPAECTCPVASGQRVLITGLTPKKKYAVRMAFKNASGWSVLGTVASATTQAPLPDSGAGGDGGFSQQAVGHRHRGSIAAQQQMEARVAMHQPPASEPHYRSGARFAANYKRRL